MSRLPFFVIATLFLFQQIDAQEKKSPQAYIQQMMEGNERYMQDKLEHPNRTSARRESLTSIQEPFAAIIGCSDSRVAPEIIFDQGIGDLFVVRIAGNVLGVTELASVEYAVNALHASVIFVLGHENCGAVKAVLAGQTEGIEPISVRVEEALKNSTDRLSENPVENAIKKNVQFVVGQLEQDPIFSKLISEGKLAVVGGYYQLATGKVELCCEVAKKS